MAKRFFKNIAQNFCIYFLTIANLIHAIHAQCFDWLLWISLALSVLSVILCLIRAAKGETSC